MARSSGCSISTARCAAASIRKTSPAVPNWHSVSKGDSAAFKRGAAKRKQRLEYASETGFRAMKTLSFLSLAASAALLPTAAFAQAAGAGVSWQGGGMRAGGGMQMGGGMRGGHAGGVQMRGGMRGGHFGGFG